MIIMTNDTRATSSKKQTRDQFDTLLEAWRSGGDVAWSELMAAWVETPTAPRSPETIVKLIQHLDSK
jgi:hypothetical protein